MPISKAILKRFREMPPRSGLARITRSARRTAIPEDDASPIPATNAGSQLLEPASERPLKRRRTGDDTMSPFLQNQSEPQEKEPKLPSDQESDNTKQDDVNPRPTCILDLPPELYRELLTYMTPGQGVLLSITCKELWARRYLKDNDCLRRLRRDMPQPERLQYLMLMGDDLPGHVFCTLCEKFEIRQRHDKEIASMTGSYWGRRPCASAQGEVSVNSPTISPIRIHRRTLELVLRAAELGENFGLPVSELKQRSTGRGYGLNALKIDLDFSSRVARLPSSNACHLLIRVEQFFEVDLYVDHNKQIECAGIGACGHQTHEERRLMSAAVRKSQQDRESGGNRLTEISQMVCCRSCPSDFQVFVKREGPQCAFVTVSIICWRDLGPRGIHTNDIWQCQQNQYTSARFDRRPVLNRSTASYPFGTESLKTVFERGES